MLDDLRILVAAARSARRRAHAPYSGFRVGAALIDAAGTLFRGANMENVAYPLGVCAERVALSEWRAQRGGPVTGIVVFTDTENPTPPCGWCRDALLEFARDAEVYLATPREILGPWKPRELVPAAGEASA